MSPELCCPMAKVRTLVLVFLGVVIVAGAWLVLQSPVYESSTQLLVIKNRPEMISSPGGELFTSTTFDYTAPPPSRVPWTTSKVTGSPDAPPPFAVVRAFPKAEFVQPLLFVRMPGGNRFFIGERRGNLYSLKNSPDAVPELAFDFRKEIKSTPPPDAGNVNNLYALAFHPKFEQNRYAYVCYTFAHKLKKHPNLENGSRISRFTVTKTDPPRLDPASEEIVISWMEGGHNGCEILFGPDGYLYFSTGDTKEPNPPDKLNTGQDCSDLLSSVLRIDVDHKDPGLNYAVPKDNPFVGQKNVRPEIWAFGFRNPWRMSFDRKTGELWLGDVGWELWEMVHRVTKGSNHGWSITEGPQPIKPDQKPGPNPIITPPVIPLPHTIAASVTGGFVYHGKKFPELEGAYLFGDWEFRRWWAARFVDGKLKSMEEITRPIVRVTSYGEDYDGEIYALDYDTGGIYTLERNDGKGQNKDFPTKLSQTGIFADTAKQVPAAGVQPFEITVPQWQDGAKSRHWIALPNNASVTLYTGEGKSIPSQVYWHKFRLHFPKDTVLVKTLTLETETGNPATTKKVETQLLHFDGLDWKPYSYAWRDDGSDADLMPSIGGEKIFEVKDKLLPAGKREQVWTFHSRTQCMTCHNQWPQYALGFSLAQLNRDGQLVRLSEMGILDRKTVEGKPEGPYTAKTAAAEAKLVDPFSGGRHNLNLDERARSYLHANCSHCHRFGGGGAVNLELVADKKLENLKILDAPPQRGDFGLPNACIVSKGHPERSTLLFRMMKFGKDRMPHIGSEWPDSQGCRLVADWIYNLEKPQDSSPFDINWIFGRNPREDIKSPSNAMPVAMLMNYFASSPEYRKVVGEAAAKLPPGPTRDLFEGYLPSDGKGRKLGSNPRPTSILPLTGDAKRGETLFWSTQVQCSNCHKVGEKGTNVGPDFTAIGKQRTREELLESMLEPSKKIDPQFTAYLVRTATGKSYTGLLVKRDDKGVILRDAQNKEITIPADDVEVFQPSRVSLMPEAMLGQLTAQEAADLLEYLVSRK